MSKLSLSKHTQKKKAGTAKILPGQRLMSSYFTVSNTPPKTCQQQKENTKSCNDEVKFVCEVKPKAVETKSNILQELPINSAGRKVDNDVKDDTLKSASKADAKSLSTNESPRESKRKRCSSNYDDLENDLDFLKQINELDFLELEHNFEELSLAEVCRCEVVSLQTQFGTRILQLASCINKNQRAKCYVLDTWAAESFVQVGDVVSVRAVWNEERERWEVRDDVEHSLLVEHPDILLGCNSIMAGLRCRRAAVLAENFRGIGMSDEKGYLILGSLLHELAQECLSNKIYRQEDVIATFSKLLSKPRIIRTLFSAGHQRYDIETWAEPYMPSITRLMHRHVNPEGVLPEVIEEASRQGYTDAWPGTVTEVVDIEETIWMPQLGLKGKLDVTCKVKVHPHMLTQKLPVELKTGQSSDNVAHRGQLLLYNVMLSELEKRPVDTGLLIYLKDCLVREIKPVKGEKRDALILRNEIAHHIAGKPQLCKGEGEGEMKRLVAPPLPPPITRPKECTTCSYLDVCTSYLNQQEISTMAEKMPQKMRFENPDFTQAHRDYFVHWTCLVQLEEQTSNPLVKLWTSTPQQREEEKQLCVVQLEVSEVVRASYDDGYTITLQRQDRTARALNTSGLVAGDWVVLGNEQRLIISLGTILEITPKFVTLAIERDVTARFGRNGFHLDRYLSARSASIKLSALGQLMAVTPEASKLRSIIIDKSPPVFAANMDYQAAEMLLPEVVDSLNDEQVTAVKKVLEARDFTLIRGLPGTGKTSTIVAVVRVLVALNRSVLITSHTNSAVDNVLVRLLSHGVKVLRLGSSHRAIPSLAPHCEAEVLEQAESTQHLNQLFKERLVVGVTCASSGHPLLSRRKFDVCIVDEATQVHQPAALSALLAARTFVLVGDPDQLQPLVINPIASKLGMKETLFERLATDEGTVVLGSQYRMNSTICNLVNHLTYKGSLKCGSKQVENASFSLPHSLTESPAWMVEVLSLLPCHSVVFLDTGCFSDCVSPPVEGNRVEEEGENHREAAVILDILSTLKQGGVQMDQVGVMSPFRAQANLLRTLTLEEHGSELEVSTIDQFQGKDKHVAVLSCVRSLDRDKAQDGKGILNDHKRLTVAVSRARVKLVIVGDVITLKSYLPFNQLLSGLGEEQMVTLREGERGFSWASLEKSFQARVLNHNT